MAGCFVGIDIGTSAVKALALAEDGTVLAKAKAGYPTRSPAIGWSEQSAEEWWIATAAATREIVAGLGGVPIAGVGLSGQLNGFVLLDEHDRPLQEAIIWLDRRAIAETEELAELCGDAIAAISGNRVSPIAVMPKLLWMKHHRPATMARARRLLLVKDYVLRRLTGTHATDPSDASATNLIDLELRTWSAELCQAAAVPVDLLPEIVPATAIAGRITAEASTATGIPAGTPVAPGGGDVAALALGCGVIADGVLGVTLGTAGHVVLSSAKLLPRAGNGLWQIAHMVDGRVIWLGLIMAGGLTLSWLHRVVSLGPSPPSFTDFVALADTAEPGARGLVFLPFLEGVATPYERPGARASFVGLTSSHGAADMVQAAMEGVAFNLRQCVELFEAMGGQVSEVRLAEGGSRVERWCQIIADVLGRPVDLIEELDTSALGAAMAAEAAVTLQSPGAIAQRAVKLGRRYAPQRESDYAAAYERYRELADLLARL